MNIYCHECNAEKPSVEGSEDPQCSACGGYFVEELNQDLDNFIHPTSSSSSTLSNSNSNTSSTNSTSNNSIFNIFNNTIFQDLVPELRDRINSSNSSNTTPQVFVSAIRLDRNDNSSEENTRNLDSNTSTSARSTSNESSRYSSSRPRTSSSSSSNSFEANPPNYDDEELDNNFRFLQRNLQGRSATNDTSTNNIDSQEESESTSDAREGDNFQNRLTNLFDSLIPLIPTTRNSEEGDRSSGSNSGSSTTNAAQAATSAAAGLIGLALAGATGSSGRIRPIFSAGIGLSGGSNRGSNRGVLGFASLGSNGNRIEIGDASLLSFLDSFTGFGAGYDEFNNLEDIMHQILMMDGTNPHTGIPPASSEQLEKIEKIKLDKDTLKNYFLTHSIINGRSINNINKASSESNNSSESSGSSEEYTLEDLGECSITQEGFNYGDILVTLPCGHCFHNDAIEHWLGMHATCPVCRLPLPSK